MADTDEPTAARLIIDGVEVPLQDGMFGVRGEARMDIDFVQQPIRLGGLGLFEPAYLRRVDCVPYPEINKALTRWHANDEPSDPARAFWSWRNFGGGHGRVGLEVVITETDDDLWTWDSWTAALVVLAGIDDRPRSQPPARAWATTLEVEVHDNRAVRSDLAGPTDRLSAVPLPPLLGVA